jgi:hypothetical protein
MLCNPLLGRCNSWTTTIETEVFAIWSVPRSYLEDNWNDPVRDNRVTLFLENINTGTWALHVGEVSNLRQ